MRTWVTWLIAGFAGMTLTVAFYEGRTLVRDTHEALAVGTAHLRGRADLAQAERRRKAAKARAELPGMPPTKRPRAPATAPPPPRGLLQPPPVKNPDDPVVVPHDKLMKYIEKQTADPVEAERLAAKFNALSAAQQRELVRRARDKRMRRRARRLAAEAAATPPSEPTADPQLREAEELLDGLIEDTGLPFEDN